jgi:hypothetical protein
MATDNGSGVAADRRVPVGWPVPGETYALDPARDRGEFCFYRGTDLDGVLSVEIDTARPDHPDMPTVEVYRPNTDFVVREVTVFMKLYGEPEPAKFYCPVCRKGPMKFHNYQEYRTLFPARVVAKLEAEREEQAKAQAGKPDPA